MTRHPDWPARLAAFVEGRRKAPFSWGGGGGGQDCALFAADAVLAITGEDPAAAFRGRYSSETGSRRALLRFGAGDLEGTATGILGAPLASPLLAQRGDVVLMDRPTGPALGVCLGEVSALADRAGLAFLPTAEARVAWRVG